MLWKLLGLQKKLDALFDDGWVTLGLSSGRASAFIVPTTLEYPGE
jgi:hypothetical protein